MTARTLEKITVVIAVAVLGLAPAVGIGELRAAPALLLVAVLVITVSAGMDLVLRGEARYHPTPDLFILPAALVVGAALFLPLFSSGAAIVAGLAVFGGLLFVVFWAEHTLRLGLPHRRAAEMALTIVGYVAAFVLYAAIYQSKTRSLVSAPAIVLVTLLLAARHLRLSQESSVSETSTALPALGRLGSEGAGSRARTSGGDGATASRAGAEATLVALAAPPTATTDAQGATPAAPVATPSSTQRAVLRATMRQQQAMMPGWPRTLVYSAVVALAAGEITWALNYWPLNGLLGGAFLLSVFYFLVGVLASHLQHRLTRPVVLEYGTVAATGTLLIIVAGLLRRVA